MKKIQKQENVTLESLYAYLKESKKERDIEFKKTQEETRRLSQESAKERAEYRAERRENYRDLKESIKETDRQLKKSMEETSRELKKSMEETSRELKEFVKETGRELKEFIKETSRELKESQKETDLQMKETDKKVREVTRQLGDMGNSHGDVAEEYFQNAFGKNPTLNGEIFDKIAFNVKPLSLNEQTGNEYDIIMVNGQSVAIIEIKYHFELRKSKLEEKLKETLYKLEKFKAFYPEYRNHKFYQGIASLSFKKNIEKIIQEAGIAVIKQVGDKMVINSENLKAF